ncbi:MULTISPECIES: P27 family phage terminase small subunit [unclassified Bradyrhizobium]|uniref:P27 family phage terminase small subunit n=1 Tax=unclassified Bradyrhizobium TaxID=2631580 RepID=UPI0033948019
MFVDLVAGCRADFFEVTDAPLLATYSRAVVTERAASAGLKEDGYVLRDGKPSPWLPILQAATRTLSTYSRMLRLNPSARASASAAGRREPEPPMSYYQRQKLLEARDDGDEPN